MVSKHDEYKEEHCRITGEICEYGSCVECVHAKEDFDCVNEGYREDF